MSRPGSPEGAPDGETWDLVVVGAGPAGSATALGALRADPRLRVLLLDRAPFPRDKSCGDGIAPHVLDALGSVGAADVVEGWAPLRHLELARGDARVEGPMVRPVHVVPREVFDARLVEHARRAGAELREHRVRTVRPAGDVLVVDGTLRAKVLVGADGAQSVVRSTLLGEHREPRAIAIRGYAPTADHRRGTQVIRYGPRAQPAYAWAFDRGDGLSNVGYGELLPGPGRGDPPSRALLLDQLEELLPGTVPDGRQWRGHHLPLSGWRWRQPDGAVLLVGDAASLVNPMTGEGIYYAVATGILAGRTAARVLAAGAPAEAGAEHRDAVRRLLGRHLRHTWTAARLARAPVVVDAGIEAARRDGRVFDTLVEIGLGDGLIGPRLAAGLARSLVGSILRPTPDPRPGVRADVT